MKNLKLAIVFLGSLLISGVAFSQSKPHNDKIGVSYIPSFQQADQNQSLSVLFQDNSESKWKPNTTLQFSNLRITNYEISSNNYSNRIYIPTDAGAYHDNLLLDPMKIQNFQRQTPILQDLIFSGVKTFFKKN